MQNEVRLAYQNSHSRLFLLDYDGTLAEFHAEPEKAVLSPEAQAAVRRLAAASGNTIVIVSGRDRAFLETQFAGMPVILTAEHGLYNKQPGGAWQAVGQIDDSWKQPIQEAMAHSTASVPGSFIEEKTGSLVWHYRPADEQVAAQEVPHLLKRLKQLLPPHRLELFDGHKNIEVKLSLTNKGEAVRPWLAQSHDFILAAGDDITDEDLFAALPSQAFSIKIGPGGTKAAYRLPNTTELIALLTSLA